MRHVRLAARANTDLLRVFDYSLRHFGKAQAVSYVEVLRARILTLGDSPFLGRPARHPNGNVRILVHRLHLIHYRITDDEILILKITDARRRHSRHL